MEESATNGKLRATAEKKTEKAITSIRSLWTLNAKRYDLDQNRQADIVERLHREVDDLSRALQNAPQKKHREKLFSFSS